MKEIVIIGAGGFGREVKMLIDQINAVEKQYDIIGFYDDADNIPSTINGLPLLGKIEDLIQGKKSFSIALGVGVPSDKKAIIKRIENCNFDFPVLIHPTVRIGDDEVNIKRGTIICAGTIITCNITIGEYVTLNLMTTVGHDTIIKDFSSCMPGVNISGEVILNEQVYIGTGAKVINQLEVGQSTVIGAGAVVSKDLPSFCTAVGIPAKPVKFHKE